MITLKTSTSKEINKLNTLFNKGCAYKYLLVLEREADDILNDIKRRILGSKVSWGEGILNIEANKQLADAIIIVKGENRIGISVKEGIHEQSKLSYMDALRAREFGTSRIEADPSITPVLTAAKLRSKAIGREICDNLLKELRKSLK